MSSSEAWKDSEGQAKEVIAEIGAGLRMDGIREVVKRTTPVNLVCCYATAGGRHTSFSLWRCCYAHGFDTFIEEKSCETKNSYLLRAISTNKVIRGPGAPLGVLFQRTPAAVGPITQVIYSSHLLIW